MDFFGKNQRTTLVVEYRGETFELEGDQAILFQAKVQTGRDFDFTFPGDDEPTRIGFDGLRTHTRTTVGEDE